MEICSYGHDEVCYSGRNCPMCEIIKDKDADNDPERLRAQLAELSRKLDQSTESVEEYRRDLILHRAAIDMALRLIKVSVVEDAVTILELVLK